MRAYIEVVSATGSVEINRVTRDMHGADAALNEALAIALDYPCRGYRIGLMSETGLERLPAEIVIPA